ncbi:hypothetical protein [Kitasatospora sp. NPDC087314]|uniref:hypothetical protein n=1 Tax=Kitasatospora sp. NPDC087314 TaxID=3364068 RepID=UPI00381786A6
MIALAVLGSNANAVRAAGRLAAVGYAVRTWGAGDSGTAGHRRLAHPTPRAAATGAHGLLTCIEEPDYLREVLAHPRTGALDTMEFGAWWLNLAPATSETNEELRLLAREFSLGYRHTPLLGGYGHLLAIGPAAHDYRARAFCDPILGAVAPLIRPDTAAAHLAVAALSRALSTESVLGALELQLGDVETAILMSGRNPTP